MKTKTPQSVQAFATLIANTPELRDIYYASPMPYRGDRTQLQFVAALMASPRWQEVLDTAAQVRIAAGTAIGLRSYCESRAGDVPAYMKAQAIKAFAEVSK
jgi:hypothetical protein